MAKLSARKIASMKINDRECDSRNLYFTKTREHGGKWSFRYQRDGKNHEMGLGPYPIISISRARYKAQQCLVLLYEGKDPLALKHRALESEKSRKSVRFSAIAEDYLDRNRSEWTSRKHEQGWFSTLRRYAYPILDRKPLSELDTTDVSLVTGSSETSPFGDMVQPAWLSHSQIGEACTGQANETSKINANSITNQIDQTHLCIGSAYYHYADFTRISTCATQRSQSG